MRRQEKRAKATESQVPRPHWSQALPIQILVLALLVLLAYANSLGGSFHFDDNQMMKDPFVTGPGSGWEIFRLAQTRPLTFLTFHWNHLIGGANPWGYHAVNVILHAGNSILVLLIAQQPLSPPCAFFAASVFAVHPLQSESVSYVFQRATLLATFFALLSFRLFLRERYVWSVAAFGMSLLAKEETMALPAFLLLYDLAARRGRPIRRWYYAALFALTGLAVARLFYALHVAPVPTIGFNLRAVSTLSYLLTQARVVWNYLRLFVVPWGLNLDHDVQVSQSLISPWSTLPAVLGLTLVIAALSWMTWRGKWPALWVLGFFVLLAPSSSVVPAADVMFEHRTYFPLTCLVMAAAWAWGRMPRRVLAWTGVALLAALSAGTMVRNRAWHDEESLWADVVEKSPRKARPHVNLGNALADQGKASEAIANYLEAVRIEPDYAEAHDNLGNALARQGRISEAIVHYSEALRIKPDFADAHFSLAHALAGQGRAQDAIAHYTEALRIRPAYAAAHINLGIVLAEQGRVDEAIAHYTEALRINPDFALAHANLAFALASRGRVSEAIAHYSEAVRLKPDYAEAHNNLGFALASQGRASEAIAHYAEAVRLKPDYAEAHTNLGAVLADQGRVDEAIREFLESLRIKPDQPDVHCNVAVMFAKKGQTAEAVRHLQAALDLNPRHEQARRLLNDLASRGKGSGPGVP